MMTCSIRCIALSSAFADDEAIDPVCAVRLLVGMAWPVARGRRFDRRFLPRQNGDDRRPPAPAAATTPWRALSPAIIGKHIPGNPTVVVRNMPGAGGITAVN